MDKAYKVLETAARQNCRRLPPGQLVVTKRDKAEGGEETAISGTDNSDLEEDSSHSSVPKGIPLSPTRTHALHFIYFIIPTDLFFIDVSH